MSDVEFECRKCGKRISLEAYERSRYCPDCGTLLQRRRSPKYWVFQFNSSTYTWFDWVRKNREVEQWLTSQYAREIRQGDKVAIWSSGKDAGVYALGEVATNPRKSQLNPEQRLHWTKKADVSKFQTKCSVIVRYSKVIVDRPLLEAECAVDTVLSNIGVLRQAQGTNFPLTKDQWNRILELVNK